MSARILVLVGTRKGAFVMESDSKRRDWKVRGPYIEGSEVFDLIGHVSDGKCVLYAGVNLWTGAVIEKSTDLGISWKKLKNQPRFPKNNTLGLKVERIWNLEVGNEGELYAGVEPAALFKSHDDGEDWEGFEGLNFHETRKEWQPGAGGLCLHTIIIDPRSRARIRVGISAVGVVGSDDYGETWAFYNKNIRASFLPNKKPVFGQCVHKIAFQKSKPDTLYLQNHGGVYSSQDFGRNWKDIGKGLPSDFGFPVITHPHDPDTAYVLPVKSDSRYPPGGELQVWRSNNGGKAWQGLSKGLPKNSYFNILREAMDVDDEEPCGVYFGTTTGQLFYSRDEGESWGKVVDHYYLPQIYSVTTVTL